MSAYAATAPKPTRAKDISPGDEFGYFRVLAPCGRIRGRLAFLCRCRCGRKRKVTGNHLLSGRKSCGCARTKFGRPLKGEPEYRHWRAMISRCEHPANSAYPLYGGRGIAVCRRWRESYQAFRDDMGRRPSDRHTLGRIDNDRGYEPGNVRWETPAEQNRNTRVTRRLTFRGQTRCLKDWAIHLGVRSSSLSNRLRAGWPVERVLGEPMRPRRRKS